MNGRAEQLRRFGFLMAVSAIALAGCGYQQSGVADRNTTPGYQWHSLYREDIHSVAVPVFVAP